MADPQSPLFLTDEDINAQYDPGIASDKTAMQDLVPRMQGIPTSPSQGIASALISALPMLAGLAFGGKAGAGYGGVAGGLAGANYNKTMEDQREKDQLYAQAEYRRYQDDVEQQERDKARAILSNKQDTAKQLFDWQQRNEDAALRREEIRASREDNRAYREASLDIQRERAKTSQDRLEFSKQLQTLNAEGLPENVKQEFNNYKRLPAKLANLPDGLAVQVLPGVTDMDNKSIDELEKLGTTFQQVNRLKEESGQIIKELGAANFEPNTELRARYGELRRRWMQLYSDSPLLRGNPSRYEAEFVTSAFGLPKINENDDYQVGLSNGLKFLSRSFAGVATDPKLLDRAMRNNIDSIMKDKQAAIENGLGVKVHYGVSPEDRQRIMEGNAQAAMETLQYRYPKRFGIVSGGFDAPTSQPQSTAAPAITERPVTQITPEQKAMLLGKIKDQAQVQKAAKMLSKGVPFEDVLSFFGD